MAGSWAAQGFDAAMTPPTTGPLSGLAQALRLDANETEYRAERGNEAGVWAEVQAHAERLRDRADAVDAERAVAS